MNRSIFLGSARVSSGIVRRAMIVAVTAMLAMALPAFAEEATGEGASPGEARRAVAPPGQCAEPRAAVDARTGEGFSVVGPVSELFDAIDVAAAPSIEGGPSMRPAPPTPRPLTRPGACDQPGSGCSAPSPSGIVVEPPAGGGDLPPPGFH